MSAADPLPRDALLGRLRVRLPELLAVYAFGSRIEGSAHADSDLDLAVLVEGRADPMSLFELAGDLAELTRCPVDLLDFRTASTVMQHRILVTGERWWARDAQAGIYEAFVLSEKLALDAARAGLLDDIRQRGTIHGG